MRSRSLVVVMWLVCVGGARAQEPALPPGTPTPDAPGRAQHQGTLPADVVGPVDPIDALRDRTPGNPVRDLDRGTSRNVETDPIDALRSPGTIVDRDELIDDLREDRRTLDEDLFLAPGLGLGVGFGFGASGGGGGAGPSGSAGGMRVVPVTTADLAGAPERYLGRAVVVRGDVDGLDSTNLFTLDEDSVLIVNPAPGVALRGDDEVVVTGVVRRLVDDDMRGDEEQFGLSAPALRSLQGRAVIVAQSVQLVPGS